MTIVTAVMTYGADAGGILGGLASLAVLRALLRKCAKNLRKRRAQRPRQADGRRETILYALGSNARTFRLCLILLVTIVAPVAAAVIAELIRHMLLRDVGARMCR
jgi:hypothetical protein